MLIPQKAIKNIIILGSGEAVSKAFGFVSTIYLGRVLGLDAFGMVGFVGALYAYCALLVTQGTESVGMREVARNPSSSGSIVHAIFFLRLLLAAGTFALVLIIAKLSSLDAQLFWLLVVQSVNLFIIPLYLQFFFQGIQRMGYVTFSRISQSIGYLITIVLFVESSEDVLKVPLIYAGATLCSLVPMILMFRKKHSVIRFEFDGKHVVSILKSSFPLALSALFIQIYYNLDSIMIGYLKGMEEVGLYTGAYKIVLMVIVLPRLILMGFFPSLSLKEDNPTFARDFKSYVMIMAVIGIPVGFVGSLLAKDQTIALPAAGAIPFYSGLRAIDILGLTEPPIAHHDFSVRDPKTIGHIRSNPKYVLSRRPDIIMFGEGFGLPEPHMTAEEQLFSLQEFHAHYELRQHIINGRQLHLFHRVD